jgi:DNA-binding CsgD family transcriptional regulator
MHAIDTALSYKEEVVAMSLNKTCQISDEFSIVREGNGIRLVAPKPFIKNIFSVRQVLNLPFNAYFYIGYDTLAFSNEVNANSIGFTADEIREIPVQKIVTKTSASILQKTHQSIYAKNQAHILEEMISLKQGSEVKGLTIKFPWYAESQKPIGIFGISAISQENRSSLIPHFLSTLMQTGLLVQSANDVGFSQSLKTLNLLTKREKEVAMYVVRGKSYKQIANLLAVSHRTIEHHVENIKKKLNVFNKSQLIENLFDVI